ncbi:glycoside hydrolase family 32 protein [Opitutales bacterium]|nr:glycoside hydrolase family 32 protein [Opitutales bacterium]
MKTTITTLMITMMASVCSAQGLKAELETPAMPENPSETWLTYHLAHPGPGNATPGDPNPAFFWKGRYHLHYIYKDRAARKKQKGRDWGPDWAHVSSEDMVHWTWHPTVLGPKTMGHGMFSGTGFITKDDRAGIIYHGRGSKRNWISYALDDNLDQWSKPELVLPNDKDGNPVTDMPYFDPDLWINGDTYYALNARSSSQSPVIMKSDNLKDWDYIGELLHPDFDEEKLGVGKEEDISCPNMFKLGDKWMLLCISHNLGCRYFIGDFKDEQFLPEQHGMMNWAAWDFFAPESLLTPDGRRVMWSWCTTVVSKKKNPVPREIDFNEVLAGKIQTGIQSLPRELSLSGEGTLLIKPLRELRKLRTNEKNIENLSVKSDTTHLLQGISGDTMELELVLEAPTAKEFGIKVLADQDGNAGFIISSGKSSKTLNVGYIQPPFELKEGEGLTLRIFIDKNMIEVFANDRQAAVAWHEYDPKDLHVSLFSKGGDLKVKSVSAWQMKSCY